MNIGEFRAWFEGLCEGMDGLPNEAQWARIRARIAELSGDGEKPGAPAALQAPKPAPKPTKPFFIDDAGMVRDHQGMRVTPAVINGDVWDHRGIDGDINTITWADGSQGLGGADIMIVAA